MAYLNIGNIINFGNTNSSAKQKLQMHLDFSGKKSGLKEGEAAREIAAGSAGYYLRFKLPGCCGFSAGDRVTLDVDAASGTALLRRVGESERPASSWKLRLVTAQREDRGVRSFSGRLFFRVSLRPGLLKLLGLDAALMTLDDEVDPEQELSKAPGSVGILFQTGPGFADKTSPAPLPCDRLGRKDAHEAARMALKK
jgi:hypothetical protein